jgi:hypothetical protein
MLCCGRPWVLQAILNVLLRESRKWDEEAEKAKIEDSRKSVEDSAKNL